MLIRYEPPQFIFVHVYKAAGKSLAAALGENARTSPRECIFDREYVQHLSARHLEAGLPRSVWARAFKFAFVRNPWDRWVSLYEFILARPRNRDHRRIKSFGSFGTFIRWVHSDQDCEILIKRTQQDFLCDEGGRLLMDYVGQVESLADHLATICARLELTADLPHLNANPHRHYREYYDADTRDLVAASSQFEIGRFGYRF
jgi:Sulfotransferase family